MIKKLTLLAMALGALVALAVPAMAGAAELTNEKEEAVEVGSIVTAESTNTVTTGNNGAVLSCAKVHIEGTVGSNSGGHVKIDGLKVTTSTPCSINGAPVVHIRAKINSITFPASGPAFADGVTFESEITNGTTNPTCHFQGKGTQGAGTSLPINILGGGVQIPGSGGAGFNLAGSGPAPCPSEADIAGTFALSGEGEAYTLDP